MCFLHLNTLWLQMISLPKPFKSACDEKNLQPHYKVYSEYACLVDCYTRIAVNACSCRMLSMPPIGKRWRFKFCGGFLTPLVKRGWPFHIQWAKKRSKHEVELVLRAAKHTNAAKRRKTHNRRQTRKENETCVAWRSYLFLSWRIFAPYFARNAWPGRLENMSAWPRNNATGTKREKTCTLC